MLRAVDYVSSEVDKLEWWKNYTDELLLILLVQPSSVAAERVFCC